MKALIAGVVLAAALGGGLWKIKGTAEKKSPPRVALAGGIYTKEPPGLVGLYEETSSGAHFTMCDTGEKFEVRGGDETMSRMKLAYRSLRLQASDGIVAELYGVAGQKKGQNIFEAQGIRSVHPRLDGECSVTAK